MKNVVLLLFVLFSIKTYSQSIFTDTTNKNNIINNSPKDSLIAPEVKNIKSIDLQALATEEILKDAEPELVTATFKGTRVVNGQSVEGLGKGEMQFMMLHRFDAWNRGIYDLFGLDGATIRIGFDYGVNNKLTVGLGRSRVGKAIDTYFKYKILAQTKDNEMPVTLSLVATAAIETAYKNTIGYTHSLLYDMYYSTQLLIARKFSEKFSVQLTPMIVHRNLVQTERESNDLLVLGVASRLKITKRMALTGEIHLLDRKNLKPENQYAATLGIDIETGGHVFQLHFTNATGMIEHQYIANTIDKWDKNQIHFGFNLSRVFNVATPKKPKSW